MNSKPPSLTSANVSFFDAHPAPDDCHKEILAGLQAEPKTLDPTWFYDAEGSALFEQITAPEMRGSIVRRRGGDGDIQGVDP